MDKITFDDELNQILTKAETALSAISNAETPDLYGWYPQEHTLWALGEEIRQLSLQSRRPFDTAQANRILAICQNPQAGRGRQSFILLLGKSRYSCFSESILSLLHDRDVEGHVINTLTKMRVFQYADEIRPFLTHQQTWIRNEAKHYLQRMEKTL